MKLTNAAKIVEEGAKETLSYYEFPSQHWRSLRTNNPLERLMREIRRRTRVVGAFPDGQSALKLVAARLRHVSATRWGTRQYLNMDRLTESIWKWHERQTLWELWWLPERLAYRQPDCWAAKSKSAKDC